MESRKAIVKYLDEESQVKEYEAVIGFNVTIDDLTPSTFSSDYYLRFETEKEVKIIPPHRIVSVTYERLESDG